MRYVAAYLLASLGGNDSPSGKDLEKIIGSVGIECEADKLKTVIDQLKGKNLEELIQEGQSKLASVPAGGAVAASGGGGAGGAAPAEDKKAEAKKEEKKEESEESDDDMGFGLFD